MKIFLFVLLGVTISSFAHEFKVGDLIFTTYRPCYVCHVIEDETGSPYSHVGLVVKVSKEKILIADSLGKVKTSTVEEFVEKSALADLYRIDFSNLKQSYSVFEKLIYTDYLENYSGLLYDKYFDWENSDENGEELLYCSEFIVKILDPYFKIPVGTKPMNYTKNYDFWLRYFGEIPIPQDKPGMNPGALARKPQFKFVKNLKAFTKKDNPNAPVVLHEEL